MFSSIKAKIIVFYLVVLFFSLSILGIFLYFGLQTIVYRSIDSSLLSRARALALLIPKDEREAEFAFSDDALWEYHSSKSRHFFQIRRGDGTTIEKSASLRDQDLPWPGRLQSNRFENMFLKRVPLRMIILPFPGKEGRGETLYIQCAEDIREQKDLLQDYQEVLFSVVASILILSAFGGFLISRKALAPIQSISETMGRISEINLSERITEENIPRELGTLAASFNRTLERLEGSFQRQKQFAADASHELRTPLAVILSQGEVTLRKDREGEEYRAALRAMVKAARMMSEIIGKLLSAARLGTEGLEPHREEIALHAVIRESLDLIQALAETRNLRIGEAVPESLSVRGDRVRLKELFTNLLDNAVKYNVPAGKIDISGRWTGDWVQIDIRDTGIGIPEAELGRVFDRFYRVDKSRSRDSGGAGLGLSICREIVKQHGGRIELKSAGGAGVTVSVYLPVG